jgi:hypothetical protein
MTEEADMKRTWIVKILTVVLLVFLPINTVGLIPVLAQDEIRDPGLTTLTFAELGMELPRTLVSPISEVELLFNLPSDWAPTGTGQITLNFSAFFSALVASEDTTSISGQVAGDLSVFLNGTQVGLTTLSQNGEQTMELTFDTGLLTRGTRGGSNSLRVRWDGSISCLMNLLSSATVLPTSTLAFSHTENTEPLTLNDFPAPFLVENTIQSVPLDLVVASEPGAGELRAAMILAAGMARLFKASDAVQLLSLEEYQVSNDESHNLLLVASTETVKALATDWGLDEVPVVAEGVGIVHLFTTAGGYGLLISGDESGVVKAAQAVSAGQVLTTAGETTMLVNAVNAPVTPSNLEDATLTDLGVSELVFTWPVQLVQSFDFHVPAESQVRADAYFDLILSHSQQLDYLRSGLQVKVNGYPAASLRLNDTTSNQSLFRLILPANLMQSGRNTIELAADLNTRDLCSPATETEAWLRVSSSSLLHLPLESAVGSYTPPKTFADFPGGFLSGNGLNNVWLQVAPGDFSNIQAAGKIAQLLGAALPQVTLIDLQAVSAVTVESTVAEIANLILVGSPLAFTSLNETDMFPSLVFDANGALSEQSALELVTQPGAGVDLGYLAIRGFAPPANRALLAVLGNTPAGLENAVTALSSLRTGADNFVMTTTQTAFSGWLDEGIASGKAAVTSVQPEVTPQPVNTVQQFRRNMLIWAVPGLALLLAIALFLVYVEIRHNLRKN